MRVVGIHLIAARELVHLIEVELDEGDVPVDWSAITQPLDGQDESHWQVPYDERELPGHPGRWCFFFHYLDQARPLSSPRGPLKLLPETPVPERLRFMQYVEP